MTDRVNEDSKSWVEVKFHDEDDRPYVPATIYYRIDCETTGKVILGDTQFTPVASTVRIPVGATLNYIVKDSNKRELRALKAFGDYHTDDQQTEVVKWFVINLSGV